jgi:hypothetical protein
LNNPSAQDQLITYGSDFSSGNYVKNNISNQNNLNLNKQGSYFNEENFNPNNDSPISSKMHSPDLTKDNIYLKGGNNLAEALIKEKSLIGIKTGAGLG